MKNNKLQKIKKKLFFLRKIFKKGLSLSWAILLEIYFAGGESLEDLARMRWDFKGLRDLYWWPYDLYLEIKAQKENPRQMEQHLRTSLKRLIKEGLLKKDKNKIKLTSFGKEILCTVKECNQVLEKWDGKIRLVIFDIPEKKAHVRKLLRGMLRLLGYQYLQKSVYIGKTALPVSFYKILDDLKIKKNVYIFIVKSTDKQNYILSKLNLLKRK